MTTPAPRWVTCPTCSERALWSAENRARPFCSDRCKLIDLGAWANNEYRIEREAPADPGEAEANLFERPQ